MCNHIFSVSCELLKFNHFAWILKVNKHRVHAEKKTVRYGIPFDSSSLIIQILEQPERPMGMNWRFSVTQFFILTSGFVLFRTVDV